MSESQQRTQGPPPRRRGRLVVRLAVALLVAAILLVVAGALIAAIAYEHVTMPGTPIEEVAFVVPEGASGRQVGRLLAEQGFIEHEILFRLALRLDDTAEPVRYGSYRLERGLSASELLRILQKGPEQVWDAEHVPPDRRVTVPEGLTLAQAAQLFDDPQAFLGAAAAPDLVERVGLPVRTLEGFLMPDTYYFDRKPTPRELVERMVEHFEETYAALCKEFPEAALRSKIETVTVASLVEEEARVDHERPLIAAVIYNRLKRRQRLEMDATLQYALGKYGERLLAADKEVDSPYNTYRVAGLPPGPISSPGAGSLRAAMNPAPVDYLYFVSNADGESHTFNRTLAEHQVAVNRFRREIAVQRRTLQTGPSNEWN